MDHLRLFGAPHQRGGHTQVERKWEIERQRGCVKCERWRRAEAPLVIIIFPAIGTSGGFYPHITCLTLELRVGNGGNRM